MSIFGKIKDAIFGHHAQAQQAPQSTTVAADPGLQAQAPMATGTAASDGQVDVGAVLDNLAQQQGGGGNYRTSIVDLLKLLGLDSTLAARKALADELNVHVNADGSAEENIALHKAVMDKLAENGGIVPAELRG